MRTDARIFRVASPLGLGRCCTGGGGCWLCGGDTDMVPPLPRRSPSGPRGNGSARGRAEAQGARRLERRPQRAPRPAREGAGHAQLCSAPHPAPASPGAEWVRALSPKAPLARRGTSDPDTVPGAWTLTGPSLGRHPGGAAACGSLPSHTWPAHVLPVGSRGRKRGAGQQPGETSHRGAVPPPHTQGTILGSLTPVAPKTLRGPITCHGLLRPCQGRRGSARPGLSPAQPLVPPSPVPSP